MKKNNFSSAFVNAYQMATIALLLITVYIAITKSYQRLEEAATDRYLMFSSFSYVTGQGDTIRVNQFIDKSNNKEVLKEIAKFVEREAFYVGIGDECLIIHDIKTNEQDTFSLYGKESHPSVLDEY